MSMSSALIGISQKVAEKVDAKIYDSVAEELTNDMPKEQLENAIKFYDYVQGGEGGTFTREDMNTTFIVLAKSQQRIGFVGGCIASATVACSIAILWSIRYIWKWL